MTLIEQIKLEIERMAKKAKFDARGLSPMQKDIYTQGAHSLLPIIEKLLNQRNEQINYNMNLFNYEKLSTAKKYDEQLLSILRGEK